MARLPGRPSLPIGTIRLTSDGYISIKVDEYTWKLEHTIVAERALRHTLPPLATMYHIDGERSNNENKNLVICEDNIYNFELRARRRIQKLGKDPWKYKFHRGQLILKD